MGKKAVTIDMESLSEGEGKVVEIGTGRGKGTIAICKENGKITIYPLED